MPLLEFWQNSRPAVEKMKLETVIRIAGDGELKDGSEASKEFREFLTLVESDKLAEYAQYCLDTAFPSSGQVLQDIVNEIGQRLGFSVEWGRYQGVRNEIGFDGIWKTKNHSIVVEVKTTNTYTVNIETVARYRDRLIEDQRIPKQSSILIVLGRDDNDSRPLEAQVRGSPHLWTTRIIGVEALVKLMEINLSTQSDEVVEKIHTILQPFDYTRIDKIVDVVFTTAEDIERDREETIATVQDENASPKDARTLDKTPQVEIEEKKKQLVERLATKTDVLLQKKRHSMYSDKDNNVHAVIAISKRYEDSEIRYWYAYHAEPQRQFLSEAKNGYMVFGMADAVDAFAIPFDLLEKHWSEFFSTTRKNGKEYKHIYIVKKESHWYLRVRRAGTEIPLDQYSI